MVIARASERAGESVRESMSGREWANHEDKEGLLWGRQNPFHKFLRNAGLFLTRNPSLSSFLGMWTT